MYSDRYSDIKIYMVLPAFTEQLYMRTHNILQRRLYQCFSWLLYVLYTKTMSNLIKEHVSYLYEERSIRLEEVIVYPNTHLHLKL